MPRVSAPRHSRHDQRYAASLRSPSVCRKKLTIDFAGGNQSSDAGLLLLREAEESSGCAGGLPKRCRIAANGPHPARNVRACNGASSAIACGHEDGIDLDRLRHDPLMKVAVGRCPESGAALPEYLDFISTSVLASDA